MECWYDSLFECDCAGIFEMMKVPCAGTWDTRTIVRNPLTGQVPLPSPIQQTLLNRISWIASCGNLYVFDLIAHDNWKTNLWHYYIQAHSVVVWYESAGVWLYQPKDLNPKSCYYLGRWPWCWDFDFYRVISPHGSTPIPPQTKAVYEKLTSPGFVFPKGRHILPFNLTTFTWTEAWIPIEAYTDEDLKFYFGDHMALNLREQEAISKYITERLKKCTEKKYPPSERKPRRIIQTPEGPVEWPGKPMSELTTPTPGMPLPTPKMQLQLILTYSPPKRPDGLWTILEIKGPL